MRKRKGVFGGVLLVCSVALLGGCGDRKKAVEANNRGFQLLTQKRRAEAIIEFERGIKHDPKLAELHLGLGRAYEETQQYSKAEQALKEYTRLRSSDVDGHYFLGLVLEQQSRPEEAAKAFRTAANLPASARTHLAFYHLGRVLTGLGQLNDAADAFRQSARADNTFLRAYEDLALLYADNGDLASAEKALVNAVATQLKDAHINSSLGVVYSKMADRIRDEGARNTLLDKAAAQFLEATKVQPSYARAYWNLGMTLAKIMTAGSPSRRKDAVHYLQLFLSRHGKDDELSSQANDMISHLSQ
jgi:tetratricopeptide (TPR) repeat protein